MEGHDIRRWKVFVNGKEYDVTAYGVVYAIATAAEMFRHDHRVQEVTEIHAEVIADVKP